MGGEIARLSGSGNWVKALIVSAVLAGVPISASAQEQWTGSYTSKNSIVWTYALEVNGERVSVRGYGERDGKRRPVECKEGHVFKDQTFQATCTMGSEDGNTIGARFGLKAVLTGDNATMTYSDDKGGKAVVSIHKVLPIPPSIPSSPSPPTTSTAQSTSSPSGNTPARVSTPEELEHARFVQAIQPDLKQVQQGLKALGFYNGVPDGAWGPATDTALKQWQLQNLKPQTGILTASDIAQLKQPAHPVELTQERWHGTYVNKSSNITWINTLEVVGDRVNVRMRGEQGAAQYSAECQPGNLFPNRTFQASCTFMNDGGSPGLRFSLNASLTDEATRMLLKDEHGETATILMRKESTPTSVTSPSTVAGAPPVPARSLNPTLSISAVASNETNKFLLEGNPADTVVVLSEHPDAPHAAINLRGDPTFKTNTADICFVGSDPLPIDIEIDLYDALNKKGAVNTKRLATTCDASRPDQWDISIGRRSDFLALPKATWERLDKALQDAKEKELLTVLDSETKVDREARAIAGLSNESRISSDGINGWGFVFPESDSSVVCVISAARLQTFEELLSTSSKALQKDLGRRSSFKVVMLDADTAFINSRKKLCGAIFANQPDLKAVINGFRKFKVSYKVASVWLSSETVESALAATEGQKAAETQAQADTRRNAEAARELRRQREEADGTRIREATAALRRQHGAKVAALAAEMKAAAGDVLQSSPPSQSSSKWYEALFPQFANWMQERRNEGWEPVSHDVDVLEFGEANWNKRALELILVRTHGTIKNRAIGKYLEFCFDNAYVDDPEFQMRREPFMAPCAQAATVLPDYLKGLAFQSEWNAK